MVLRTADVWQLCIGTAALCLHCKVAMCRRVSCALHLCVMTQLFPTRLMLVLSCIYLHWHLHYQGKHCYSWVCMACILVWPFTLCVLHPPRDLCANEEAKAPDVCIDCVGLHYATTLPHKLEMKLMLETDSPEAVNEALVCVRKGGRVSVIAGYAGWANHFNIGKDCVPLGLSHA